MDRAPDELTCRDLVELVTEYLEGVLAPRERARFEAHLEGCAGCRIHLAQMRHMLAVVRATADPGRRPDVAALLETFRGLRRPV
jgi:anti-sigma factor RsiW